MQDTYYGGRLTVFLQKSHKSVSDFETFSTTFNIKVTPKNVRISSLNRPGVCGIITLVSTRLPWFCSSVENVSLQWLPTDSLNWSDSQADTEISAPSQSIFLKKQFLSKKQFDKFAGENEPLWLLLPDPIDIQFVVSRANLTVTQLHTRHSKSKALLASVSICALFCKYKKVRVTTESLVILHSEGSSLNPVVHTPACHVRIQHLVSQHHSPEKQFRSTVAPRLHPGCCF